MYNLCSKTRMMPTGLCFLWSYLVTDRWHICLNSCPEVVNLQCIFFLGLKTFHNNPTQPDKKCYTTRIGAQTTRKQISRTKSLTQTHCSELRLPTIPYIQVLGYHLVSKPESYFRSSRAKGSMFPISALVFPIALL